MGTNKPFLLNPDNRGVVEGSAVYSPKGSGAASIGCLALFSIAGLLASCLFLSYIVADVREWWQLRLYGVETTGVVLGLRTISDEGTTYYVSYSFRHTPPDGDPRTYSNEETVAAEVYERLEKGGPISVRYLPDSPVVSRPASEVPQVPFGLLLMSGFWGCWSVLFNGIPLVVLFAIRKQQVRDQRLKKHGYVIIGEILAVRDHLDSDGDLQLTVEYRFQSPRSGQEIRDRDAQLRNYLKGQPLPSAGSPVALMYADDATYAVL